MAKVKLKPCPFCGGEASISESFEGADDFGDDIWLISCKGCHAEMRDSRYSILSNPMVVKGDTYIDCATNTRKAYTDKEIKYLNQGRFVKDKKEDLIKDWNKRS